MPKIIHAISGPRNISTALMYSFAQRPGCEVIDEPMYGVYLKELDPDHPGKEETLAHWPTSVQGVKEWVRSFDHCQELYLKNMAHHMDGQPWHWVEPSAYLFWIRHPRKVVQSFTKVIDTIVPKDIGLLEEWDQFQQLQHGNVPVVVVDSDEMLSNPARNMAILCQALGLAPREAMMNWPPGKKKYDGPWWPHWYANVHKSEGFGPAKAMPEPLREDHEAIVAATLPAYEALYNHRLQF